MTDQTTTEAAAESTDSKAKTVIPNMAPRSLFDSTDAATAFIARCQADLSDFGDYPVAFIGATEDDDFDPEVYTADMQVAVARLTERGEGAGKSIVKAIVIYPSPRMEALQESALGTEWMRAIIAKELQHIAVRNLRKAETPADIADAIGKAPTTIAAYLTSGTESSGGIATTYNDLWQTIKKAMAKQFKAFALLNPSKKELRKAMESASYAASVYPRQETRTNKRGEPESLFELAARFGQMVAEKEGKDPAFFVKVLATRNETTLAVDDDEDDFDLEAMAADAAEADSAEEAADATEAEATA